MRIKIKFADAESRLSGLYTTEHLAQWWLETTDEIDDDIEVSYVQHLASDGDEIAQALLVA